MNRAGRGLMRAWIGLGPRFLPFADAAAAGLPFARLLRLSLFQVSVGMCLVLVVGTLNRVMIVELGLAASLVGAMIALPLLAAPFRALIGFRSDNHRSELGWRRVPFMYRGAMLQFGGLSIMPFALLVLAGIGKAAATPAWVGLVAAAVAFLLVGAGMHIIQTVGLALATDLAEPEAQPSVVGLMCAMQLLGMVGAALLFGAMLADFTPGRLVQVIQAAAVATLLLNLVALWKQEPRRAARPVRGETAEFRAAWAGFRAGGAVMRRLAVIGLGTLGFGMGDVLVEPYGGEVLALGVGDTTRLTAALAFGGLGGLAMASVALARGGDPFRVTAGGLLVGLPGFAALILAAPAGSPAILAAGILLVGFGAGLFGHGTLTAAMRLAPRDQAGLALGSWGAVQATAAGLGIAFGGALRDLAAALLPGGAALPYAVVYGAEALLLIAALVTIYPLMRRSGRRA
jgi:BCD family chlorophyll transporter-like MFS transporter